MEREYLDFDLSLTRTEQGYVASATGPAGTASSPFVLPFEAPELAAFMVAVGPPRVSSRRLVPTAARVGDVRDYGSRLGDALFAGDVGTSFREGLTVATAQGKDLRVRLRLDAVPQLDTVPWEYVYSARLGRFVTLSQETPIVRLLDAVDRPPAVTVEPPLRVLVMISSPAGVPPLAVEREEQLLRATTADLVAAGTMELVVLEDATLTALQRALIDRFHVFHFIGHGGFDAEAGEGVLVLEREDGTAHRVSGQRLGTLLHDARDMQLAVLNACEGARTSGRDAFSGVGQALVRQGLPAVVAMQTEISDRAALVFSHEFYWFLTRGLGIDAAMCEVRKAMAISDEASEWGTAVLLRSGADQPFTFTGAPTASAAAPENRWASLYSAAQGALAAEAPATALPMLEQIAAEKPDYADVTALLERVRPAVESGGAVADTVEEAVGRIGRAGRDADEAARQEGGEWPAPSADSFVGPYLVQSPGMTTTAPGGAPGEPTGAHTEVPPPPDAQPDRQPDPRPDPQPDPQPDPGAQVRPEPPTPRPTTPDDPGPHPRRRIGAFVGGAAVTLVVVLGLLLWLGLSQKTPPPGPSTPAASNSASETTDGGDAAAAAVLERCGSESDPGTTDRALPVPCTLAAPSIDGSFDEWQSVPAFRSDATVFGEEVRGLAGEWHVTWDRHALYLAAAVNDTTVRQVDPSNPSQLWRGDSVSFEFGPDARDLGGDSPLRDGADRHVILALHDGNGGAVVNLARGGTIEAGGFDDSIAVAGTRTDTGYAIEARVPWSSLGVDAPDRGAVFAANFDVSDAADTDAWTLRTMLSSNPDRRQTRPASWQQLVLDGPTG